MDINEATAKAISAERAIAGLTVRELSARSGIPMSSLMRALGAEREIKINQIAQLAAAFEIYPHELVEHAERILERDGRTGLTLVSQADVVLAAHDDLPGEDQRAEVESYMDEA